MIGAAALCLFAGPAPVAHAQDCVPRDDEIAVYEHDGYEGHCVRLDIRNRPHPTYGIANDTISSVLVGKDVEAVLCEHDDYDGVCQRFETNIPRLADEAIGNDRVSSIKVLPRGTIECIPGANQVALFKHPDFLAPCVMLNAGVENYPRLATAGLPNDSVSSVKLGAEVRAVLCEHANFEGKCRLFQGDDARLSGASLADDMASSAWVFPTPSYRLPASIYAGRSNDEQVIDGDRDLDGLLDDYENVLAEEFKPLVRIHSKEGARRTLDPTEPVTLFQVRPYDCAGRNCNRPTIVIRWSFLFLRDGGYPNESGCDLGDGESHAGDNDRAAFVLGSGDRGRTWELEEVHVGDINDTQKPTGKFVWPFNPARIELSAPRPLGRSRHPSIFMSNGKHHLYLHAGDQPDSPYSKPPGAFKCNDFVDDDGVRVFPNLWSAVQPVMKTDAARGGRRNNVGEPEVAANLPDFFVNDLRHLFPVGQCPTGREAWSRDYFCSDQTFRNHEMWQSSRRVFKP